MERAYYLPHVFSIQTYQQYNESPRPGQGHLTTIIAATQGWRLVDLLMGHGGWAPRTGAHSSALALPKSSVTPRPCLADIVGAP